MPDSKAPTRGFVTIATGRMQYFRLAYVLLLSYRLSTSAPMPFAIITDRRNRYTDAFDNVVLIENPKRSYMDKLDLLVETPYDESIFIDADCIAFGDLNCYWDSFEGASDLSAFGYTFPRGTEGGWFSLDGTGKYRDRVAYGVHLHGVAYFIRRGETCQRIREIAWDIANHYGDYRFQQFQQPADEPILALAMAVTNCVPVPGHLGRFVWFQNTARIDADFFEHKLRYALRNSTDMQDAILVHYSTGCTHSIRYLTESKKVLYLHRHGHPWSAARGRIVRAECKIQRFFFRVRRKIKHLCKARK